MLDKYKIGILGAGAWGIALARMLSNTGNDVAVWSSLENEIDALSSAQTHPLFPDVLLPSEIIYTKEISTVCQGADILVFAVPSLFFRATVQKAAPYIQDGTIAVSATKGIEEETLYTMTEIFAEEIKNPSVKTVVLSGPTHAEEVIRDLPTAIVSASEDASAAKTVQSAFTSSYMRVYTHDDVRGVELCGALKNIISLASGIATGLGLGDNARAALITRGMVEIRRLGIAMGCKEQTFYGLSGIGDLIVTATSKHSRNNQFGILIGSGVPIDDAIKQSKMLVEGINALPAATSLAKKYNVEMPIISTVDAVVSGRIEPSLAICELMNRRSRADIGASKGKTLHK
ncbi:MAG: NAD(P)-dependent glycerol-3-phosphate dehydrogenase [Clostridia bacterium]|nr:NAD(P)-dependent glycerol-3-phosphate dehydrogenase [Clostridia bacterium]